MSTQTSFQGTESVSAPSGKQVEQRLAPARILEYAQNRRIALPIHTTLEIVEDPEIFPVPRSAPHGIGLFYWQERWLPVIDLGHLFQQADLSVAIEKLRSVLVIAYQRVPGQALEYGAIVLPLLPETIFIGDDASCALPEDSPLWPEISLSCFTYKDAATPIVDTGRLFGRSYS